MSYLIRQIQEDDFHSVLKILNYFIENSMASYRDEPQNLEFLLEFKGTEVEDCFKVIEYNNGIIGFGALRKYAMGNSFNATSVLSYFIMPEHTGKGLGSKMLDIFISNAKEKGIKNLLAHISSENEASLKFHKKHGFEECGRLKNIGVKFKKDFDVVWMQRRLDNNLQISKEIEFSDIEAKDLDVIKPLWEKLNQYHQETSKYFKQRFYTLTFKDRVNNFITNDNDEITKISVAKDMTKDRTVGYCISKIKKSNTGEVESLFIEPDYRGMYIGDYFMKDALEWFKEQEVKSVSIGVAYGNDNAIHFYKKYGFNTSLLKLEMEIMEGKR